MACDQKRRKFGIEGALSVAYGAGLRVSDLDSGRITSWITRMAAPCSSRCVAKLCRKVWGDTRLEMPAALAAACMARLI